MYSFIFSNEGRMLWTDLRELRSFSFVFIFSHDFPCTRIWMPFPFFPNVKPRNLKFRIANTLTTHFSSGSLAVSVSLPDTSCLSPAVSLRLWHFWLTLLYHPHIVQTPLLVSPTPGRTHSDRHFPAMVKYFLPAANLPLSPWLHRFPWLHFLGISLSIGCPFHPLLPCAGYSKAFHGSVYQSIWTGPMLLHGCIPVLHTLLPLGWHPLHFFLDGSHSYFPRIAAHRLAWAAALWLAGTYGLSRLGCQAFALRPPAWESLPVLLDPGCIFPF